MTENSQTDAFPPESATSDRIPKYEIALSHGRIPYSYVAETYFGMYPKFAPNDDVRRASEKYYPQLLQAFESANAGIVKSYSCEGIVANVTVTANGQLFYVLNEPPPAIYKLLATFDEIYDDARQVLQGDELETCLAKLYSILAYVMEFYDQPLDGPPIVKSDEEVQQMVSIQKAALHSAERYLWRAAQRSVRFRYLTGMGVGLLMVPLVLGLPAWGLSLAGMTARPVVVGVIAGAVGAVVSVLTRISTGKFVLSHHSGLSMILVLGALRPVVGGVFGGVLNAVIVSGLLPIALANDENAKGLALLCVGFLGGFNERWARDMLESASSRVEIAGGNGVSVRPADGGVMVEGRAVDQGAEI